VRRKGLRKRCRVKRAEFRKRGEGWYMVINIRLDMSVPSPFLLWRCDCGCFASVSMSLWVNRACHYGCQNIIGQLTRKSREQANDRSPLFKIRRHVKSFYVEFGGLDPIWYMKNLGRRR
jgi:hypothetical protein